MNVQSTIVFSNNNKRVKVDGGIVWKKIRISR